MLLLQLNLQASSGVSGQITASQDANTASLSGSVTAAGVSGSITATQANNTSALAGAEIFSGGITATQAANTAYLTGVVVFSGAITALQSANTASVAGSVAGGAVSGAITATQDDNTAQLTGSGGFASYTAEVNLGRKWYVKRRNQLYIFDSAQEADSFIAADDAAEKAIKEAQKTSKKAKKRARQRVYEVSGVTPEQTISIDWVAHLVSLYGLPFDLPSIVAKQDYEEFVRVALLAQQMQDEDDIEMLLLA